MRMLLALGLALTAVSASAELYRWVDDNGAVHYGDRIPPEYAKQRREILDERGNVRAVKKREPTSEEREAAASQQRDLEAERKRRERQAAYDRSLTSTYATLGQLERAYQDRLEVLDARVQAAESTVADLKKQLERIRSSDGNGEERTREAERAVAKQLDTLERLRERHAELHSQFERDRQRYMELTGDR